MDLQKRLKQLLSIEEIDTTEGPILHSGDLAKLQAYISAGTVGRRCVFSPPASTLRRRFVPDTPETPTKQNCVRFKDITWTGMKTQGSWFPHNPIRNINFVVQDILTEPNPGSGLADVLRQVLSNPKGPIPGVIEALSLQAKGHALERIPLWEGFNVGLQGVRITTDLS